MASIKVPTPLRVYTGGNAEIDVSGDTVAAILQDLVAQYPELEKHIFNDGQLRDFVNVFIGEDDIRDRNGVDTEVGASDKLRIIPSIAGGSAAPSRKVDHSALRTNQSFIIGLLVAAFIAQAPLLVAFVSVVMIIGTLDSRFALFKAIYANALRPAGIVKPDVQTDNPEPHRFAQGLGGAFTGISTVALVAGIPVLGWALAWLVVGLAALNLFAGFCAGCFVYYQLSKRNVPGFSKQPMGS